MITVNKINSFIKHNIFNKVVNSKKKNYIRYSAFRKLMLEERSNIYHENLEQGLLSIITSVWNTKPTYIDELVESLLSQRGGTNFEWIILDNGSDNTETIDYLKTLHQYPFVKLYRVEKNQGIINGMRFLLEKATGKYIIPMDSDDVLYPDAIVIITAHIKQKKFPALLYSDEDKIEADGSYGWPYFKPDWDPVLFINSCYIAHVCVIDRLKALELEAYTDSNADGSHDWDTFVRFYNAGYVPEHIPEVIYSWRMHPQSTAMNSASKDYLESSQLTVLNRFLSKKEFSERYFIDKSQFFPEHLNWWIRRKPIVTKKVLTVVFVGPNSPHRSSHFYSNHYPLHQVRTLLLDSQTIPALLRIAKEQEANNTLIHCIWECVGFPQQDWINDVLLNFELFPDTVMVGSRIMNTNGQVISAGSFFGFKDGCGCPDEFRPLYDRGYFGRLWKPHSVGSVSSQHVIFDTSFLIEFLQTCTDPVMSIYYLGEWAGAFARRRQKRVVYTPHLTSIASDNWYKKVTLQEKHRFNKQNYDLFGEEILFSKHLNASGEVSYRPWTSVMRKSHLESLKT